MKVLVINCGSSSLKYQLIDSDSEQVLAKGLHEVALGKHRRLHIGVQRSRRTDQAAPSRQYEKDSFHLILQSSNCSSPAQACQRCSRANGRGSCTKSTATISPMRNVM